MAYFRPKIIILLLAVLLDLLVGDPHFLWHPVRGIGKLIEIFERFYRNVFSVSYDKNDVSSSSNNKQTLDEKSRKKRENIAGFFLVSSVIFVTGIVVILIFIFLIFLENNIFAMSSANALVKKNFGLDGLLTLIFSLILSTQCLSARQLSRESNKVYDALTGRKITDKEKAYKDDANYENAKKIADGANPENTRKIAVDDENHLKLARKAVSMIVGRDTENLSKEGVIKATVETIAENTSDGIIAPMFYLILFGPLGGIIYKAVNTMDSMIGYKNDRYKYFGTFAARLDDIVNFIPARISGFLMVLSAYFCHFDGKNSWKIWRRDRRKSKSPNSAQCESAVAGALDISLLGNAYYFGKLFEKPEIGDSIRKIETDDIKKTEKMMYMTEALFMALSSLILWGILH